MTTILVVEDEAVVAMDIERRLVNAGYDVCKTASTGESAIRCALERHPDLVLMDIHIKGDIDGIETAERLRRVVDIPVVYLTAYADRETLLRAKTSEPYGYVVKPFEDRELHAAIEMGLYRHKLTVQLNAANEQLQMEVAERRRAEESLRASEERYALAARGASDGIWDWSLTTNHFYASPRWKQMLGFPEYEIGAEPGEWINRIHPEDRDRVRVQLAAHLDGATAHFESEYRILNHEGNYRWMLCRAIAIRDQDGKAYRMAGSQTDITERKVAEQQLLHDAFHDALTGLPNRALFLDRLSQAIERVKRHDGYLFAVLFLDFDNFKSVSDNLGHTQGDQLLVTAADRFSDTVRGTDTVARFGGDEFVFLLGDLAGREDALAAADRIQMMVRKPFAVGDQLIHSTASIGIVIGDRGSSYERADEVLRDADIAMYRAKSLGRARSEVFEARLRSEAIARIQLQYDLRAAVERREFRVYYQPIVAVATGRIAGFEALVRWQHPTLGLLPPSEFIGVAEETGSISAIGDFVLREACRQIGGWQADYPSYPPLFISVNVSAAQLGQPDFPQQVACVLKDSGLSGSSLWLEITETMMMRDLEASAVLLKRLKAMGVQIVVDDFGTGYSSLAYLQRLMLNGLKIDGFFVNKLDRDSGNVELVRTIVGLAHRLSMAVTAEGIETNEQLAMVKGLKCEFGQGFLLSKPLEAEAVQELIARLRDILAPGRGAGLAGKTEAGGHELSTIKVA